MPGVFAVYGDMDRRADMVAGMPLCTHGIHEQGVAYADSFAVNCGCNALPRYFGDIFDIAAVGFMGICLTERDRYGMR